MVDIQRDAVRVRQKQRGTERDNQIKVLLDSLYNTRASGKNTTKKTKQQ